MGFKVNLLADSISPSGHRLVTMEVSYSRIIHAEMLRHRVFERCAASSRAIPVQRFIEQVTNDPYVPSHWGSNKSGMSAGADLAGDTVELCTGEWLAARDAAVASAERLLELGVHKQLTNRLLEPFQWMTEIITGTEWDNFFHLRIHPDAHPDIQRIAGMMKSAIDSSVPASGGLMHLPLLRETDYSDAEKLHAELGYPEGQFADDYVSLACIGRVARTSYLRHSDESDFKKDVERSKTMLANAHMSPFGHVARPMTEAELFHHRQYRVTFDDGTGTTYRIGPPVGEVLDGKKVIATEATYFCGNLNGWIPYRKTIAREWDRMGTGGK